MSGSTTYDFAGIKKSDFGLTFGAAVAVPVAPLMSVFADVRYNMGLSNILVAPVSSQSTKWTDFLILVGLRFDVL